MTEPIDNIRSDYSLSYVVDLQRQHTKSTTSGDVTITTVDDMYDGSDYSGSSPAVTYEKLSINDGSNTRVVYFSMSFGYGRDDTIDMSGGPSDDDVANRIAAAINGTSTGTAVAVTATANTGVNPAIVTLTHDSGGDITVTKGQHLKAPYSAFSDMNQIGVTAAGTTVSETSIIPFRLSVPGPASLRGQTIVGSDTDDILNRGPFKTSIGKSESFVS